MRLTIYTDYTLRVLIYLALRPDRLTTVAEIAEHYRVSRTHLMKVVHQLGLAGDIETIRGKGGGMRLAKPADAINVGQVIRRTEADMEIVPCFGARGVCAIESSCVLQGALREALKEFLVVLDRYALADLIAPRRKLASLLDIPELRLAKAPPVAPRPTRGRRAAC